MPSLSLQQDNFVVALPSSSSSPSSLSLTPQSQQVQQQTPRRLSCSGSSQHAALPASKCSSVDSGSGSKGTASKLSFVAQYCVCNSVESKTSTGYPQTHTRGDVFGSYTDFQSPRITSVLLPPQAGTCFVGLDGKELLVRWAMVSSLLGHSMTAPCSTDLLTKLKSVDNLASRLQITPPTVDTPTIPSAPHPHPPVASCSTAPTGRQLRPSSGLPQLSETSFAPQRTSAAPVALIAVSTFQHISIYVAPLEEQQGTKGVTPNTSYDLIQTWTAPTVGKRCTAQLVAIVGAVADPARLVNLHPSQSSSPTRGAQGHAASDRVPSVTINCEAVLLLGFERGDIVICSIAEESVVRRINASPSNDASHSQLIAAAPCSMVEVQSSAQRSLRHVFRRAGTVAPSQSSMSLDDTPRALFRNTSTGSSASRHDSGSAVPMDPEDCICESIYAVGFDNGTVLVVTVILELSSLASPAAGKPSSPTESAGQQRTATTAAAASTLSVHLRQHINFGYRPIAALEASLPSFFNIVWSEHEARLAVHSSARGGSPLIIESVGSSRANSVTDHPATPLNSHEVPPTCTTAVAPAAVSPLLQQGVTFVSAVYLYVGSQGAGDGGEGGRTDDDEAPIGTVNMTPPSRKRAGGGAASSPQQTPQELWCAISCEGGTIYVASLPTFEKVTSISNRAVGSGCGDYLALQWVPCRGSLTPQMLLAGGQGDDIDVFVVGRRASRLAEGMDTHSAGKSTLPAAPPRANPLSPSGGGPSRPQHWAQPPTSVNTSSLMPNLHPVESSLETTEPGRQPPYCTAECAAISIRPSQRIRFHRSWVNGIGCLALPGGDAIAVAVSIDNSVSLWRIGANSDSRRCASLAVHEEPVLSVTNLHEDLVVRCHAVNGGALRFAQLLVTVCTRGKVKIWQVVDDSPRGPPPE